MDKDANVDIFDGQKKARYQTTEVEKDIDVDQLIIKELINIDSEQKLRPNASTQNAALQLGINTNSTNDLNTTLNLSPDDFIRVKPNESAIRIPMMKLEKVTSNDSARIL